MGRLRSEGVGSNHFLVKFSITLKCTKKEAWTVKETHDHLHYHQSSTFKSEINFPSHMNNIRFMIFTLRGMRKQVYASDKN